jgi:hypothetical protein
VLEPCFGDGSFILPLIEAFLPLYPGAIQERLDAILTRNIFGIEVDAEMYQACLDKIVARWGYIPNSRNLVCADFFRHEFYTPEPDDSTTSRTLFGGQVAFDIIVGNPPFGGTIALELQEKLDRTYGFRNGDKIKKETYAFFIVKCLDQLRKGGRLLFICSDTFVTIPTMRGLRKFMMEDCDVSVQRLGAFSDETSYPMVLLKLLRSRRADSVVVDGQVITRRAMELTGNFSWAISDDTTEYFSGPKLSAYVICSSGMTIGKNDLFVRDILDGHILEPYDFDFFDDPVTVKRELERARYHTLSPKLLERTRQQEQSGVTRRNVRIVPKAIPERIYLPHPHYRFYNKASGGIIYQKPKSAIFWKDDGDAVLTYKKNGNWYLHGVGGQRYFGRSGLTWQLVSHRLNVRYLPEGYILDSGAPCAFLRPGVDENELYFILGWTCTELCTRLLKTVVNHTMNIQSKDFERLPYPWWVKQLHKDKAVRMVRALVDAAMRGENISRSDLRIRQLADLYKFMDHATVTHPAIESEPAKPTQLALWLS